MSELVSDVAADESTCGRCLGPNVVWSAPSPLWNQVMRGGSINGNERFGGIVCPICFADLAKETGVADLWYLMAERVYVKLETVTPSGRIWSESQRRWIEGDETTTDDYETAALEGWATNLAIPLSDRLAAALQVIKLLHARLTAIQEVA